MRMVCYGCARARPSSRLVSGVHALRSLSCIRGARLGVVRTVHEKKWCTGATSVARLTCWQTMVLVVVRSWGRKRDEGVTGLSLLPARSVLS